MIIGIDGNEANVEHKVGVSVYTQSMLEHFAKVSSTNTSFKVFLRSMPLPTMPKETPHYSYEVIKGSRMWSQVFLPWRLYKKKDIDVFFSPAHYSPRYCPVPLVVTIHDLSYYYYPDEFLKKDLYKLTNWTAASIGKAREIIAVSKTTKKDIQKYFDVDEEHLHVIYNGFEKHTLPKNGIDVLKEYDLIKQKYLMYVGTLQPRKNIPTLVEAFAAFHKTNKDFKLVIVGKHGWLFDNLFESVKKYNVEDAVIFTGFIPDEKVAQLYSNAFCFVLPSLYEGFGIPILEAMSYRCPVISSHASSLPEIGADACLYFDPKDSNDLQEKISMLYENKSTYSTLIKAGEDRVKNFSWEQSAKDTLDVIIQAGNK
ncbi:MAG: glycosyltransferase family 1 protein [bacterium]|nr:glycosyltransferase family 1 protein [bacterium]